MDPPLTVGVGVATYCLLLASASMLDSAVVFPAAALALFTWIVVFWCDAGSMEIACGVAIVCAALVTPLLNARPVTLADAKQRYAAYYLHATRYGIPRDASTVLGCAAFALCFAHADVVHRETYLHFGLVSSIFMAVCVLQAAAHNKHHEHASRALTLASVMLLGAVPSALAARRSVYAACVVLLVGQALAYAVCRIYVDAHYPIKAPDATPLPRFTGPEQISRPGSPAPQPTPPAPLSTEESAQHSSLFNQQHTAPKHKDTRATAATQQMRRARHLSPFGLSVSSASSSSPFHP